MADSFFGAAAPGVAPVSVSGVGVSGATTVPDVAESVSGAAAPGVTPVSDVAPFSGAATSSVAPVSGVADSGVAPVSDVADSVSGAAALVWPLFLAWLIS